MTPFYLLSGAGNDFIAIAEPALTPAPHEIRRLCRRGLSVGADGLLLLRRGAGHIELAYFNADGGGADLCVNGTRCAARLADHLGWADGSCVIRTGAGPVRAQALDDHVYETRLEPPRRPPQRIELATGSRTWSGWRVDVGVPHLVIFVGPADLDSDDFEDLARPLRHHERLGAAGANVDFACPSNGGYRIRSFERGVEAETLACGTGALAVAAAAVAAGKTRLPVTLHTRGGFPLAVRGRCGDGEIHSWALAGDARLLAIGHLTPEATVLPD